MQAVPFVLRWLSEPENVRNKLFNFTSVVSFTKPASNQIKLWQILQLSDELNGIIGFVSDFPPASVKVLRALFCDGADFGKLFLQIIKVLDFGVFADLDETGIRC